MRAVIDYQADAIVKRNTEVFSGANGVAAWRKMVIAAGRRTQAVGGCQLGSLGSQLAETDPQARARIAAGFDQWTAAISGGLKSGQAAGTVSSEIHPDELATTLLATLEGGLLLAQVKRDIRPFETAVNTLMALMVARS